MVSVLESYGFERWPALRESARKVTDSMQRAMRFMDSCKEVILIVEGMPMTAQRIHRQAHTYGELWDSFGDILHQRHLIQVFPATPELDEEPDLTRAFEIILGCMESILTALGDFILAADRAKLYPLGRAAENLQCKILQSHWPTDTSQGRSIAPTAMETHLPHQRGFPWWHHAHSKHTGVSTPISKAEVL